MNTIGIGIAFGVTITIDRDWDRNRVLESGTVAGAGNRAPECRSPSLPLPLVDTEFGIDCDTETEC